MMRKMSRYIWVVLVLALNCQALLAGEYKGDKYSLVIPDGWTVSSEDVKRTIDETVKSTLKQAPGMDAVFQAADGTANVNVVITKGAARITQSKLPELRAELVKSITAAGIDMQVLDCQVVEVDDRNFVLLKAKNYHSQFSARLLQWTMIGCAGGKTYTFTFTSKSMDPAKWDTTFDEISKSVRLQAGQFDWFHELPSAVRSGITYGIAGGLIGGLFPVVRKLKKKRVPPPQPPVPGAE
jgi:hypothetical protein